MTRIDEVTRPQVHTHGQVTVDATAEVLGAVVTWRYHFPIGRDFRL